MKTHNKAEYDKLKEDLVQAAIVAIAYADISGWLHVTEFEGYEISLKANRLVTKTIVEN